jgi:hypothetical protein
MPTQSAGVVELSSDDAVDIFDTDIDGVKMKGVFIHNLAASAGRVDIRYVVSGGSQPLKAGDWIPCAAGWEGVFQSEKGYIKKITVKRESGKAVTLHFGPWASP